MKNEEYALINRGATHIAARVDNLVTNVAKGPLSPDQEAEKKALVHGLAGFAADQNAPLPFIPPAPATIIQTVTADSLNKVFAGR